MGRKIRKLGVVALALVASTCTPKKHVLTSPNTLRVQLNAEPATLDFSLAEDGLSMRVLSALMSGLTHYDREYRAQPEMAESVSVSEGGRRYRVKLKPWKWSDGQAVQARDFVYGMRRTLSPEVPAKLADLLFFIEGALDFRTGKLKDFSKVGVRAVSESELEFRLVEPIRFFPQLLSLSVSFPQREDLVMKYGDQWPRHMVSTGPYRLSSWDGERGITLERNPFYSAFETGAPEHVEFALLHEDSTAVNLFENGKLDVLFRLPALDIDRFRARGLIHEFPYFATYYIGFNQRAAPWDDVRARLAVAQAIDRSTIQPVLAGGDTAAASWIPKGFPGHNDAIGVKHDQKAARENWEHSKAKGLHEVALGFDSSGRNTVIAEKIRDDLKKVLGVEAKLEHRDWKAYVSQLTVSPPALFRFGWLALFVDPFADLFAFESGNSNNYTGWKSGRYDALLAQIARLPSSSPQRQKAVDAAQRLLLEDQVVVVPIFHYAQTVAISQRVSDLTVNGMGAVDWMKVRLK